MKWKIAAAALFALLVVVFIAVSGSGQELAWKRAMGADTIAAYDNFRSRYPNSAHAAEAATRLAQLHEDADWQAAELAETISAYDDFRSRHPDSSHTVEASKHLAKLHEEVDWNAVKAKGTLEAIDGFLAIYANGQHQGEATRLKADLQESKDWETAVQANTVEAVDVYLKSHSSDKHADKAAELRVAILDAQEKQAWEMAVKADDAAAYNSYLKAYPSGRHVDDARNKAIEAQVWEGAVKADDAAGYNAYVQAYPSGEHAGDAQKAIEAALAKVIVEVSGRADYKSLGGPKELFALFAAYETNGDIESLQPLQRQAVLDVLLGRTYVTRSPRFKLSTDVANVGGGYLTENPESHFTASGGSSTTLRDGTQIRLTLTGTGTKSDGELFQFGTGKEIADSYSITKNTISAKGSMTISSVLDGNTWVVSTELPRDRIAMTGMMMGMSVAWPIGDGTIYGFRGNIKGFLPAVTIKTNNDNAVYFALVKDIGLVYLAGTATVSFVDPLTKDVKDVSLPIPPDKNMKSP